MLYLLVSGCFQMVHSLEKAKMQDGGLVQLKSGKETLYAFRRCIVNDKTGIDRDAATLSLGFSVRCIKNQNNLNKTPWHSIRVFLLTVIASSNNYTLSLPGFRKTTKIFYQ